jgi:hypothetical protein
MTRNHPKKTSDQEQPKPKLKPRNLNAEVSSTQQLSLPSPASLTATLLVAAPPPSYSADEPDSASSSSSDDSDEFTTRPADKKNGRKRAKPKSQSAGFEMPRISSRNGKELPNYNEADAYNLSEEESEGEYVSAQQKRIDDRKSTVLRPAEGGGDGRLTKWRIVVSEPEDAVDGVFGHKRDDAHCEYSF